MIVRLVAEGNSLIAELLQPLFVDSESNVTRFRQRVVAEDICHVVEQAGGCEQDGGRLNAVDVVQQELRVSVSLIGGLIRTLRLGAPFCATVPAGPPPSRNRAPRPALCRR